MNLTLTVVMKKKLLRNLRTTQAYKDKFPGIFREDGKTLRIDTPYTRARLHKDKRRLWQLVTRLQSKSRILCRSNTDII